MLSVHLFVSYAHVNLCHLFSFPWCLGLVAASACGSSWTFLFTFLGVSHLISQISSKKNYMVAGHSFPLKTLLSLYN